MTTNVIILHAAMHKIFMSDLHVHKHARDVQMQ